MELQSSFPSLLCQRPTISLVTPGAFTLGEFYSASKYRHNKERSIWQRNVFENGKSCRLYLVIFSFIHTALEMVPALQGAWSFTPSPLCATESLAPVTR